MPLSNLFGTAAGTCRYCGNKAGLIARDLPECKAGHNVDWNRMVEFAAEAARTHNFDEKNLRLSLAEIARTSYEDGTTVNQALEEGWKRGVGHAMADGIVSQPRSASKRTKQSGTDAPTYPTGQITLESNPTEPPSPRGQP